LRDSFGRAETVDDGLHRRAAARRPILARPGWAGWLETLGVALSPAVAVLVLRLRLMAPSVIADPAFHTINIIDPHDSLTRFAAHYAHDGRLREVSRVGFLVPARLAYLAFGAVPGFFVTRYVLALVAVGPVYLLLRRLYGRPAGVVGILVVLSSPVIVTAWGTDYPDSAVVSYATGALACLAMPCAPRWRRAWLAAAGVLLVLTVWSHGVGMTLVGAAVAGYIGVRLLRDRAGLAGDLALLAGVAVAVTGVLVAASGVLLGHADFISPTWQAYSYLSSPSQTARWHTANWRWVLYVTYLLVPPAVLGAFVVAVARRGRAVPTPVLLVGVVVAAQLVAYFLLQFVGSVPDLEMHYFSSTLWAGVCLAFAITVAELSRPLSGRPLARWLPAAVLLAVPLGYEAYPHVPSFGWAPFGVILAAAVVAAAAAASGCARIRSRLAAAAATGLALVVLAGAILVLTVAPIQEDPQLRGHLPYDPAPAYFSALGGSGTTYIDGYRIATEMPGFVGPATYRGEQILVWQLTPHPADYLIYALGMYYGGAVVHGAPAGLTRLDREDFHKYRPGEVLLLGSSAASFPTALRSLAAYRPTLTRAGELRAGPLVLHIWVIRVGSYYHRPASA